MQPQHEVRNVDALKSQEMCQLPTYDFCHPSPVLGMVEDQEGTPLTVV